MRRMMTAVAAVALLTSGCATYSWYRADTPADVVARDQAECYDLARASAVAVPFSAFPGAYGPRPWPAVGGVDPYPGLAGDPRWRTETDQRSQDQCMRGRGYELRRAPKT